MEIQKNLELVREQIRRAAEKAGRDPAEIKLIAVSKTKPVSMIQEAVRSGIKDFGENRPQELAEKFSQISDVHWHQIGQLQKNKVKYIIDKVSLIHSVDSLSLAQEIEKRAAAIDKIQEILIQVNISGEATKSGVSPKAAPELCRAISDLRHIRILGLMTISVQGLDETGNQTIFSGLRQLSQEIKTLELPGVSMDELSMGMTHDYEGAIAAGATLVRIGTGIFGVRDSMN